MVLYECPCGDLDCGALTVELEFTPATVTWNSFGWQVGYQVEDEDMVTPLDPPLHFTFERAAYVELLESLLLDDRIR